MWVRKIALSAVVAAMLSACGGGGGADVGEVTPETVLRNLSSSNIDSTGFPWSPGVGAGITKRWNLLIPVKTNGEARAVTAMNTVEQRLGYTIFDRTSIEATANDAITRGRFIWTE